MFPILGHLVAMIEIFVGLMSLALITGLMFARFSRPRARFLFTKNAVVRPIAGQSTLLFRAADQHQNIVQDASAQLYMLCDEVTAEGYRIRPSSISRCCAPSTPCLRSAGASCTASTMPAP